MFSGGAAAGGRACRCLGAVWRWRTGERSGSVESDQSAAKSSSSSSSRGRSRGELTYGESYLSANRFPGRGGGIFPAGNELKYRTWAFMKAHFADGPDHRFLYFAKYKNICTVEAVDSVCISRFWEMGQPTMRLPTITDAPPFPIELKALLVWFCRKSSVSGGQVGHPRAKKRHKGRKTDQNRRNGPGRRPGPATVEG